MQSLNSDSAILDTYTTTAADQGNYIGCTVTYLGTTVTETERTQCLTAPGPVATMYGLRFDGDRDSNLAKSVDVGTTYTASIWVKFASTNGKYNTLLAKDGSNFVWQINPELTSMALATTDPATVVSYTFPQNQWIHLVVTQSDSNIQVFVNGSSIHSSSITPKPFTASSLNFEGTNGRINGYLSEVYFVEQALPPEVFGKNFEPYGWGPLDSSQIKENIGEAVISPYDTRANTSQVWSNQVTATTGTVNPSYPITNAFDGNFSTFALFSTNTGVYGVSPEIGVAGDVVTYYGTNGGGTITINGTTVTGVDGGVIANPSDPITLSAPITSIGVGSNCSWGGLAINGRLLVDQGVWNNSQNWSASNTGTWESAPLSVLSLFDGDLTTSGYATSNNAEVNFTGLTAQTSIRVYGLESAAGDWALTLGGSSQNINLPVGEPNVGWVNVSAVFPVSVDQIKQINGGKGRVYALEIDGAILVDAGAQWNTSQLWSSGTATNVNPDNPMTNAFDGNTTTFAATPSGPSEEASLQFSTGVSVTASTSVEFYVGVGGGNQAGSIAVGNNGSKDFTLPNATITGGGWRTLPIASFPYTFNQIWTARDGAGQGGGLAAVRVDGVLLVDQGSFGANGFYLPFNPEAVGVDYSSSIEVEQAGYTFKDPQYCFDGKLNTFGVTPTNGLSASFPSVAAIPTGLLEVYGVAQSASCSVKFDDVQVAVMPDNYGGWTTVGNLDNVEKLSISSSGQITVAAFRINGEILVDHNSIGVDDSGNGNDFYDQGFVINSAPIRIENITYSDVNSKGTPTDPLLYYSPTVPISGVSTNLDYDYWLRSNGPGNVASVQFSQPMNGYMFVIGSTRPEYSLDSGTWTYTGTNNYKWIKVLFTNTSLIEVRSGEDTQFAGLGFIYDENDNQILVQNDPPYGPNYLLDTVTDTPLMNYAVLQNATNGNLSATSKTNNGTTSTLAVVGKVYAECMANTVVSGTSVSLKDSSKSALQSNTDISNGDLIGIAVDEDGNYQFYKNGSAVSVGVGTVSTANGIYIGGNNEAEVNGGLVFNFGQQPFVASNVTYDQATGTVEIPADLSPYEQRANTSQVWSSKAVGNPATPAANATDGDLSSLARSTNGSFVEWDFTGLSLNGPLRIYPAVGSSTTGTKLEVNGIDKTPDLTNGAWSSISGITSTTSIKIYADADNNLVGIFGIEVDGRLLVDQGVWDNSQNWSDSVDASSFVQNPVFTQFSPNLIFTGNPPSSSDNNTAVLGNGTITFDPPIVAPAGSKIYVNVKGSGGDPGNFTTNSGTYTCPVPNYGWVDVGTTLSSITLKNIAASSGDYFSGVRIDDTILVDSGDQWNTSQVWSSDTTCSSTTTTSSSILDAFDGSIDTQVISSGRNGTTLTFAPNVSVPISQSIEVYLSVNALGEDPNAGYTYSLDGTSLEVLGSPASTGWVTLTGFAGKSISSSTPLVIEVTTGTPQLWLSAIRIDGVILVDPTGGTYNTLFQTWEQTKAALLKARAEGNEERVSQLEAILVRQAVPFDRDTQYPKGTIVNIKGFLFEALVDGADVSIEDFVSSFFTVKSPEWAYLEVKVPEEVTVG